MKKIQTGDMVIITTWSFKSKTGKVVRVLDEKIYVEWINIRKRAKKGQWYVDVHLPIHCSNVQYRDGNTWSKIAIKIENGKRTRVVKKTGKTVEK